MIDPIPNSPNQTNIMRISPYYQYYYNIKETSNENKEKYQQGNKLLIIDPIPNSPNQTVRIAREAVRRITK